MESKKTEAGLVVPPLLKEKAMNEQMSELVNKLREFGLSEKEAIESSNKLIKVHIDLLSVGSFDYDKKIELMREMMISSLEVALKRLPEIFSLIYKLEKGDTINENQKQNADQKH